MIAEDPDCNKASLEGYMVQQLKNHKERVLGVGEQRPVVSKKKLPISYPASPWGARYLAIAFNSSLSPGSVQISTKTQVSVF